MRIDDTRNASDIARQSGRQRVGLLVVRPCDPNVDGRRLTEIQDLIDDVGRLKEETKVGKAFGQLTAQLGRKRGGRGVPLFK